ncbi:hypothetical protein BLA24_19635 [Streptomyces cinnamoneus]|uniref:Uncharacterized protein n=1 Tax=Streptomyces cinnamoneus TaxID=53446 RepID=A0A2G1XF75_STRCJ|nr:hypothetical protein [Streptomyces cinnamoneus]PHQ49855.1 hypothetical protein BLA24_19635 [Streptomyces cinnamoneus]PPT13369.1 hypothetical protein CYQ11_11160 [Streptomyces cinnamoneus]
MPRPTPAQIAYGSATVVISTVALLLLSPTVSGGTAAVVALAALALGLAVAFAVPRRQARAAARPAGRPATPARAAAPVGRAATHAVGEHSVHG